MAKQLKGYTKLEKNLMLGQKPKTRRRTFDGDLSGVVKDSVNDIRRGLNDIVEKSIPDANYKDILRKQSGLMSAEDIIAKNRLKSQRLILGVKQKNR